MGRRVIVVGGGAAGLLAAIFAARRGASVTVLEAMDRPARKLLLTGSGRCNLTNMDPRLPQAYYGSGRSIAEGLTQRFGARFVREYFADLGLLTREKNGYVYPCTAQASSVTEVLLAEIRRQKIRIKLKEKGAGLYRENGVWKIKTETWLYEGDAVILACGSKAMPDTGSDGSGYELARSLGHRIIPVHPALTAITCRESFLPSVAGLRCQGEVSLWEGKKSGEATLLKRDTGEIQWIREGVSGIVVFQLSRFVHPGKSQYLEIDLLPEYSRKYVTELLAKRAGELPGERAGMLLTGLLQEKLIPVILKQSGVMTKTVCGRLSEEQIAAMVDSAKQLRLTVSGTRSFDHCQVCAGGVDCREVDSSTLESRLHPGLYFAGELLDVDGPCGGYNLQWAWSSAAAAGSAAAEEEERK